MLRTFLREVFTDRVATAWSIASFLLTLATAIFSASLAAWIFWPAAYVCLVAAAYRVWKRKHEALLTERAAPELQKEAEVRAQVSKLTRAELLALKHLVSSAQLTEEQIVDYCRQNRLDMVTPGMLAKRVTFLTRDYALGAWSILPLMEAAVRKVTTEIDQVTTENDQVTSEINP